MYEVMLDGKPLWAPGNALYCLTEAVIHSELNSSGYFDMTVPKTNPLYSQIESGVNTITIYKNGKEDWSGLVQDVTVDFNGSKAVYVVGVLTYLLRTVQPQHNFLAMVGTDEPDVTYYSTKRKIIEYLLNQHNAQIENGKRFYLGIVDDSIGNEYYELNMDFQYTWEVLKQLTSDTGYYRVRKRDDGNFWLDFVTIENYGKRSSQEIRFASNLLEYKNKMAGIDICTAVLPLGEKLENSDVKGMDAYLRINSVNDGLDYITDPTAVAKYGLIKKFVRFEGVTDPNVLLDKARKYLEEYKAGYLDFTLTAIDMSMLDANIDDYDVGDYVHCICETLDTDVWLPVQSKDTDLLKLANNKVNLSKTPRIDTLTKAAITLAPAVNENSVLEQANDYSDGIGEECNGYTDAQLSVAKAEIGELLAEKATIEELNAFKIVVSEKDKEIDDSLQKFVEETGQNFDDMLLVVNGKAAIKDLSAVSARVGSLESDHVTTKDLSAVSARVGSLESDHVTTKDLTTLEANINNKLKVGGNPASWNPQTCTTGFEKRTGTVRLNVTRKTVNGQLVVTDVSLAGTTEFMTNLSLTQNSIWFLGTK